MAPCSLESLSRIYLIGSNSIQCPVQIQNHYQIFSKFWGLWGWMGYVLTMTSCLEVFLLTLSGIHCILHHINHINPGMKLNPFPTKNPIRCYQWFRGKANSHYRIANFKMNVSLAFSISFNPHQGFFFQLATSSVMPQPLSSHWLFSFFHLLYLFSCLNSLFFLILSRVVISFLCWVPADPVRTSDLSLNLTKALS